LASWKSSSKKRRSAAVAKPRISDLDSALTDADMVALGTARARALNLLGSRPSPESSIGAAKDAFRLEGVVRLQVLQLQETALACHQGCSWCCHQKVGATVPEVLAIAAQLRATADNLEAIREKSAELAQDPRIFSDKEKLRARIPCVLLGADGSCQVYEVRPLPCRGWLSTDEESCKKYLDAEAAPQFVFEAARTSRALQLGLAKAMDDLKLLPYLVELTSGLDVALNEPNAAERWLAGEPLFERANVTRTP
jgi:Fe-S-cluster containining protein